MVFFVKRLFKTLPLRTVLIAPTVIQVVAVFGVVSYLSYRNSQNAVQDLASRLRDELTARILQQLTTTLELPYTINAISASYVQQGDVDILTGEGEHLIWQQFRTFPSTNLVYCGTESEGAFLGVGTNSRIGNAAEIHVANPETERYRYIYDVDPTGRRASIASRLNKQYDPRVRPWYQKAKSLGYPTWSDIYLDFDTLLPTISATTPVYDTASGELLAVCGTDVILSRELTDFLRNLDISRSGIAFIMEPSGLLIASSTPEPLTTGTGEDIKSLTAAESSNPLIQGSAEFLTAQFEDLNRIESSQLNFLLEGERQYLEAVRFGEAYGINWIVVLVVPENDFMERIKQNTRTTLMLSLAALIGSIVIGALITRSITKPILRLSTASQEIANGHMDQDVDISYVHEVGILARSFNQMVVQLKQAFSALEYGKQLLEHRVEQRTKALRSEQEKSEQLLLNILPKEIASRLKQSSDTISDDFNNVTVLFADIVEFTQLSAEISASDTVEFLNTVFSMFDELSERYGLEKIKTIGDAYMVAGGLPNPRTDHLEAVADMALAMQQQVADLKNPKFEAVNLRIGMHSGPVVAGVIGTKKFIYDLWGDTVNIASRMESHGMPQRIQVTETVYESLKDKYVFQQRGLTLVKGKGNMMTYWLVGKRPQDG